MKTTKRFLAILMALVVVLTGLPLSLLPVLADDTTNIEIDFNYASRRGTDPNAAYAAVTRESVTANGDPAAKTADYYKSNLNKFKWRHITNKDALPISTNKEGSLRYYLTSESEDDKYIALTEDIKNEYGGNELWKTIEITSNKVLDLNGHTINMNYQRNKKGDKIYGHSIQSNEPSYHKSVMFTISKGATLTIIDSSMWAQDGLYAEGSGGITFHGFLIAPYYTTMDFYTTRDLFHVENGNLVIYGGTYQAGRAKEHVKSGFTWDKLKTSIGTAVSLGVEIAEYYYGIKGAKAAMQDVNMAIEEEKKETAENDDGKNTPKGENSVTERDGEQGATKETTKSTPVARSSGKPGEGRNQTIGEKTKEKNEKNKQDNEDKHTQKPTDDKNEKDKDGKSKKIDWNSRLAAAEKAVANSYLDTESILGMVDSALKLVDDIGGMIRADETSRVTQSILGTVVKCGSKGTFVSYGGTFKGYGSTPNTRNAVVELAHLGGDGNGKAYIYGGTFEGYTGANIFNFVRYKGDQKRKIVYKAKDGTVEEKDVTLDMSETNGMEQIFYENDEAVAAKGATPVPVDTSSVVVRGGTFRNFYSVMNMAIKDPDAKGDNGGSSTNNFNKFPGTYGSVNLGVESFDSNFIRDGRIQIEDRYGDGALVLMDDERDKKTGIYHYRLFCSDQDLRYKQYLVVYPNEGTTNSTYSMRLETFYGDGLNKEISKAWETDGGNAHDGAFANAEKYFPYEIGDTSAYVIPKLNGINPLSESEDLNKSMSWYYNAPTNSKDEPIPDFDYGDTFYTADGKPGSGISTAVISQWHDSEKVWTDTKNRVNESSLVYSQNLYDAYRSNMKWFKYKVYRVDPLTKMSISESWNYGQDVPLAEVVYGADTRDTLRCKLTIKEVERQLLAKNVQIRTEGGKFEAWKGYQPGEMYRIVFSVDEYLGYGYVNASTLRFAGQLDTASAETTILFACYGEKEVTAKVDPETGHKVEDFTPLQWVTEPKKGAAATISLKNAFAGIVDYTGSGSKIFDVYYQWWEVDENGEPLRLLAGTDNVYTGKAEYTYEKNLSEKYYHKPNFWALDEEGYSTDGHNYINSIDARSHPAFYVKTLNRNGLPTDYYSWTSDELHAYTKEICGKNPEMLSLYPGQAQSLANNDVFKTNHDSCFIKSSFAGKRIRVKCIAVNMKWCSGAYDIEESNGELERYGVYYDKVQTFWSHPIQLEGKKITGKVSFGGAVDFGKMLSVILGGEAGEIASGQLHFNWQRSAENTSGATWTNIKGATSSSYTPTSSDVGMYVRCQVTADDYAGAIYSTPVQIPKSEHNEKTEPTEQAFLQRSSDSKLTITNCKSAQEYLVLPQKMYPTSLTENDWKNAFAGNDGSKTVDAPVPGGVNYVYTRYKETETTNAGKKICRTEIYLGTTVYTQDVELEVKGVGFTLANRGLEYAMAKGQVLEINVVPVPSNATNFSGIRGDKWLINGYHDDDYPVFSKIGHLYEDKACTKRIKSDETYKKVYFKAEWTISPDTFFELATFRVEFTRGYNDIATDFFWLNCGVDGDIPLRNLTLTPEELSVKPGETATYAFTAWEEPFGANLSNLRVEVEKRGGDGEKKPEVLVDFATGQVTVNAEGVEPGYFEAFFYAGDTAKAHFEIYVPNEVSIVTFSPGMFGEGSQESIYVNTGEAFMLPECIFTADGYDFLRWDKGEVGEMIVVEHDMMIMPNWRRHNHVYDFVQGQRATCQEEGFVEHYVCTVCGKRFLDPGGPEVAKADLVIEKNVHNKVQFEEIPATCSEPGRERGLKCADCGIILQGGEEIPKLAHTPVPAEDREATCDEDGHVGGTVCSACGEILEIGEEVPAFGHTLGAETVTKATLTKDGQVTAVCEVCGTTEVKEIIPKASGITASAVKFAYNGKVRRPTISVKDSEGNDLDTANYTVKWSNSSSTAVGTYTAAVTLKGKYSGSKKFTYTIVPAKVTGLKNAKATTAAIKLAWTASAGAKYYQVYGSLDGKSYKLAGTVTTNNAVIKAVAGKALTAGKTYYFKVRALDRTKKLIGSVTAVLKTGTLTAAPKISKLTSTKSKTITVTYGKVTGAKGYLIYLSANNKKWTKKGSTTKTSVSISKLTGGKKIYVKVIAVNQYGVSSAASAVKAVTVKK